MNTGRGRPKEDQEVKTTMQVGHEDAERPRVVTSLRQPGLHQELQASHTHRETLSQPPPRNRKHLEKYVCEIILLGHIGWHAGPSWCVQRMHLYL